MIGKKGVPGAEDEMVHQVPVVVVEQVADARDTGTRTGRGRGGLDLCIEMRDVSDNSSAAVAGAGEAPAATENRE